MNTKDLLKVMFKPLTLLNRMIKKNPHRILIYSNLGFRDNVRAMFDYLIEAGYNTKYEIICSLDDFKKYKSSPPQNVKFVSNKSGLRYYFTSKFMFYSFGKYPIKPAKNQVVVNLWHGMPLKTIGNLEKGCEHTDYNYFTYTIATSEFFKDIMCKSFRCSEKSCLLTGQPRCDVLFSSSDTRQKLILWLPTYRNSDKLGECNSTLTNGFDFPLIESREQLDTLNSYLEKYGYTLLIKPHPLQNITADFGGYSNIVLKTQEDFDREGTDIYSLFMRSNGLITDYSSVYFDYLLLDRPMGFTLDDISAYSADRGFVTDNPERLMPGIKITSFYEMTVFIKSVCEGKDDFKEQRSEINLLCNSHQRGNASEEILKKVGLLLD